MRTGATPGERHPYMYTRQRLRLSLSEDVSTKTQDRLPAHTCCYPLTALCVQPSSTVANIWPVRCFAVLLGVWASEWMVDVFGWPIQRFELKKFGVQGRQEL